MTKSKCPLSLNIHQWKLTSECGAEEAANRLLKGLSGEQQRWTEVGPAEASRALLC